jgi:hypothetical protein
VSVKSLVKPVARGGIPAVAAVQVCYVVISCFSRSVIAVCV